MIRVCQTRSRAAAHPPTTPPAGGDCRSSTSSPPDGGLSATTGIGSGPSWLWRRPPDPDAGAVPPRDRPPVYRLPLSSRGGLMTSPEPLSVQFAVRRGEDAE